MKRRELEGEGEWFGRTWVAKEGGTREGCGFGLVVVGEGKERKGSKRENESIDRVSLSFLAEKKKTSFVLSIKFSLSLDAQD